MDRDEMSRNPSTWNGTSTHRDRKIKKNDRKYCSEYEEIDPADVKDARPGFQTHKMEEEASSGGAQLTDRKSVDPRATFAKVLLGRSIGKLAKEYVDSRSYLPKNYSVEIYKENEVRNRYSDVLCNDRTRVVLNNGNYVHANWLPVPNSHQRFICAQGPMEETAEDFWTMIVQEKAQVVIMLCDFYENGVEKCYEYFPAKQGASVRIGQYVITNFMHADCEIDTVKWSVLEVVSARRKVLIHHFRWSDWPDHLAPLDPGIIIELMALSKAKSDVRPIVVHCSAGIGRTGTFVGLEFANERLKNGDKMGLVDIMKELRAHRLQSIQSHLQYLYLAVCLLEFFARQNLIDRDSKFKTFLNNYISYVKRHAAKHGIKAGKKDKG
uniref:Protein-tyrosine phosphatase n=1 Tax=Panagrellus redivivus TaxID=6233 RepID=A0A7E4UUD4_PANRE